MIPFRKTMENDVLKKDVIRTVLVGLGRIGWGTHLPALLAHPGFAVTAAVDPVTERLNECKSKYGINGFTSLQDAFAQENFDLAVIASPTCFHAEQTLCALNNGCHVFCDKPAAMNLPEFRMMQNAAKENGRLLTVFQPMRIDRHNLFLKKLINSGKLGKVFMVKMTRERFSCRNDWQALRKNGGGMLLNYGSHMVDQANYLFDAPGTVISCITDRILALGDADDVVKLLLRYDSVTVDIDINQAAADSVFRYAVFGTAGSAILPASGHEWQLRLRNESEVSAKELVADFSAPDRKYPPDETGFYRDSITAPAVEPAETSYYENLYRTIISGGKLINPLNETENLIRMIDCAEQIARKDPVL